MGYKIYHMEQYLNFNILARFKLVHYNIIIFIVIILASSKLFRIVANCHTKFQKNVIHVIHQTSIAADAYILILNSK